MLEEIYINLNGDYDGTLGRLMSDDRIRKYLFRFTECKEYSQMKDAVTNKDWQQLFLATHSMKGMCQNLGLTQLQRASSQVCEMVRHGEPDKDITPFFEELDMEYIKTINAIKTLKK